jgi:hypothetical protein
MTEWVDFLIYATQSVLFWVLLPRQGRSFTLPMIADRNPSWAATHPGVVVRLERSRWFLNTYYVYAAVSVALLLLITLDVVPPLRADVPKWEVLHDLHYTFMIVGIVGWGAAMLAWSRWLARYVPLADMRRATLRPRIASDYVPRSWRVVVETLTVLHLGVWLAVPVLGVAVDAAYWGRFAFIVFVTVLFAVVAALMPRRRTSYPDRIFGEGYRRTELKVAYILRVVPLIAGAMMIGESVLGLEVDRVGNLVLTCVISAILLVFLRLRPVQGSHGKDLAEDLSRGVA